MATASSLWNKFKREAAFAKYSALVVGLAAGDLKIDTFKHFVFRDFHLLKSFDQACELVGKHANAKLAISELRKGVVDELKLLNSLILKEWGIDSAEERNTDASGEIDRVKCTSKLATPVSAYTLGAMMPRLKLYAFLGKELQAVLDPKVGSHPYKKWIDTYSSDSFQTAVLQTEDLLDKLTVSLTREELVVVEKLYHQAMILEIDFFNVLPLDQPAVVPLRKEHRPDEDRLFIFSDFDLTCSVIHSSVILKEIATVTTPKPHPPQGEDQIVGMPSVEPRTALDAIFVQYTEEYEKCVERILPSEKAVFDHRALSKALVQLSEFEQSANSIVLGSSAPCLKLEDIKKAGERINLQDGCISFFQKIVSNEKLNVNVHLLSYCSFADLIRSAFSSGGLMDGALQVHANELTCDQSVTAGEIARKVESPVGKFEVFKNLLKSWTGDKKSLTVYIGDSVDDLLCLLQADIGIVIESSSSLRRVGNQFGVSFVPLFHGLVEKQKGAKGSSLNWNKLSGILYTVTSWAEIHAFILGRMEEDPPTSLEQLLPTRKRASDSEVIDSSSLSQPLPHPKKMKYKIKFPSLSVPVASQHQVISTTKQLDSAEKCATDMEEALIKENKLVQVKTIRKEEKRKHILRLIPYAWWRKRLENGTIKFQNGVMEEGRTYEVIFAVDKNKKDTKEGEETGVPLFRGQGIKRWYQVEGLDTDDVCVLEFVDSHTVKYFVFRRKDYPGFSPVPSSPLVPANSSLPLPSTSLVPSTLVATEFASDRASFKRLFLKDRESGRESGQPISGFPEDLLEHYYRLCLLEKRFIHGKVYETQGPDMGDAFIQKIALVFNKAGTILRRKVGDVTHKELDTLLGSVVFFETFGLDLGVLGKCLRDVKSIKENIDQMTRKYEEITTAVVGSIDEVLRKE